MIKVNRILLSLLLAGCTTAQFAPIPDPLPNYRHSLKVKINGVKYFGIGVAPRADKYEIKVYPEGNIDRLIWQTCHQEQVIDKPDQGWFSGTIDFDMKNVAEIEDQNSCPLSITVLTEKTRKWDFALIEFYDTRQEVSLRAVLKCNGNTTNVQGVSICQSAAGLIQEIDFEEPVIHAGSEGSCAILPPEPSKNFRFQIPAGKCTYYFGANTKAPNGKRLLHRLQTIGYTEVTPR